MKKILALILLCALCLALLTSCDVSDLGGIGYYLKEIYDFFVPSAYNDSDYYLGANWVCDNEAFVNEYLPLYMAEIERLLAKHRLGDMNISIEQKDGNNEVSDWKTIEIFIYDEISTLYLRFMNFEYAFDNVGKYCGQLYYYGSENGFGVYEDFKPLVEFLNDFTNYAAYDSRDDQNHFERLYYEAVEDIDNYSSDWALHFDTFIGYVSYYVTLNLEDGRYYKSGKSKQSELCYLFCFEGLLKALP